jgi:hypothetical protein
VLIYCDILDIIPPSAPEDVLACTADWLAHKLRRNITVETLLSGRDVLSANGQLKTWAAWDTWPRQAAIQFSHRDKQVKGRQWVTQIGVQQGSSGGGTTCSILLETN